MFFLQKKTNSRILMYTCRILIVIFYSAICTETRSQSKKSSAHTLVYSLENHHFEGNPIVPFDQSFIIKVPDLSGKFTQNVKIFKSEIHNGKRFRSASRVIDCVNKKRDHFRVDKELSFDNSSDTLNIYIDPLKPNKLFDIIVDLKLSEDLRNILMQVNSFLVNGDKEKAKTKYNEFWFKSFTKEDGIGLIDKDFYFYNRFIYEEHIKEIYDDILRKKMNEKEVEITTGELHLLANHLKKQENNEKIVSFLYKNIRDSDLTKSILGLRNIYDSYSEEIALELTELNKRNANLKSNICLFDTLLNLVDKAILEEPADSTIKHASSHLIIMQEKINIIRHNMYNNRKFLEEKLEKINDIIDKRAKFKSAVVLSGNTLASDLKTDGGRVLFMDAGLTNIFINDLYNDPLYIPRLYMGVNIYFRAINKNIRTNTLYKKRHLNLSKKCWCSEDDEETYNPDYQIISKRNIFQRLSLNVGFTLGNIPYKDFDNLYNNFSLLLGPSFRFSRAFKLSGGVALLNRTNHNPLFSEKRVAAGFYTSLSVDIDFIQGLENIGSLLLK